MFSFILIFLFGFVANFNAKDFEASFDVARVFFDLISVKSGNFTAIFLFGFDGDVMVASVEIS